MNLVFVRKVGVDFEGMNHYEFLFSKDSQTAFQIGYNQYDWNSEPADGNPIMFKDTIEVIGIFKHKDIKFDLIQDSSFFCMQDARDKIIACAWENIEEKDYNEYETYERMMFFYGETIDEVKDKFYAYDIEMKTKIINFTND